ncbi:GNAT family N-acetyltransferase [Jatrophihabitans fulvus]
MIRAEVSGPRPDLVARLLDALPDWFGQADANHQYVRDAASCGTLVAHDDDADVGVLLHRRTLPDVVDIHLMAVDPAYHRRGAGAVLVDLVADVAARLGARALTVATLGPSDPDPFYAATRAFYEAQGFVPVEERDDVWPGSPRVVMARLLG